MFRNIKKREHQHLLNLQKRLVDQLATSRLVSPPPVHGLKAKPESIEVRLKVMLGKDILIPPLIIVIDILKVYESFYKNEGIWEEKKQKK